jgi:hypothetical protein
VGGACCQGGCGHDQVSALHVYFPQKKLSYLGSIRFKRR